MHNPSSGRFGDIVFGLAAAEEERSTNPSLLLDGFLDDFGFVKQVREGNKFVILGPKGSGKSAIASRIQLLVNREEGFFVRSYQLGSFPFDAFKEVVPGREAPEIRYPTNWEFLLHVALVESLSADSKCQTDGHPTLSLIAEALRTLGLMPGKDLTQIVKHTSSREFKVAIPQVLEARLGSEKELGSRDVKTLYATLSDTCRRARPSGRHLIFIDGLDDVLTRRGKQYEALAALLIAADRMNRRLRESGVNAKLIVLCRTDLFELLPDPNNNKIRQDNTVALDWYEDSEDAKSTMLVKLLNQRATLSLRRPVDVLGEFFPSTIINNQPTVKTVLDHTRHTPRDIIQLMNRIQSSTRGARPNRQEVVGGLKKYSQDYLLPEMRNELAGLISPDGATRAFQVLEILGKWEFTFDEFANALKADTRFASLDSMATLERLFECSAVGNVMERAGHSEFRFAFKFRNRNAVFNPNSKIIVHRGILKALNLL